MLSVYKFSIIISFIALMLVYFYRVLNIYYNNNTLDILGELWFIILYNLNF